MSSSRHEESLHQQAVIEWSKYFDELKWMFAVPNGSHLAGNTKERAIKMSIMKKEGLKTGVFDLVLPVARRGFHGMFIEMKRSKGGKVSKEQSEFGAAMSSAGYLCVICHGSQQAIDEITQYMEFGKKK